MNFKIKIGLSLAMALCATLMFCITCLAQKTVAATQDGSPPLRRNAHAGKIVNLAISPDLAHIATCGPDHNICVWNTSDLTKISSFSNVGKVPTSLDFRNEIELLVGCAEGIIYCSRIKPKGIEFEIRLGAGEICELRKLDSQIILVSNERIFKWSLENQIELSNDLLDFSVSNCSSLLSLCKRGSKIEIVDLTLQKSVNSKQLKVEGLPPKLVCSCWSPDRNTLAVVSKLGAAYHVHLLKAFDLSVIAVKSLSDSVKTCQFTANGKGLIMAGSRLMLLDCESFKLELLAEPPTDSEIVRKSMYSNPVYFSSLVVVKEQNSTIIFLGTEDGEIWRLPLNGK